MEIIDLAMNILILLVLLASIIIGDTIKKDSSNLKITSRVIIGAVIYKIIGGIAIDLGLNPNDLRAINALIVIIFIAYNNKAANIFKSKKKGGVKNA